MGVDNCFSFPLIIPMLIPRPSANPTLASRAMAAAAAADQLHPWAEHETMVFQQPAQDRAQSSTESSQSMAGDVKLLKRFELHAHLRLFLTGSCTITESSGARKSANPISLALFLHWYV